jgi:hypothetical protein
LVTSAREWIDSAIIELEPLMKKATNLEIVTSVLPAIAAITDVFDPLAKTLAPPL